MMTKSRQIMMQKCHVMPWILDSLWPLRFFFSFFLFLLMNMVDGLMFPFPLLCFERNIDGPILELNIDGAILEFKHCDL